MDHNCDLARSDGAGAARQALKRGCAPDQGSRHLVCAGLARPGGRHTSQLRDWVKKLDDDPQHAFPGQDQMKSEQLEIARLKREITKLRAEGVPLYDR
jgi:transposase-like protein